MFKKFMVLMSLMAIGSTIFPATVFAGDEDVFLDVEWGNVYYDSIDYLKDVGVVEGYSDGTFKPDQQINRAEFLKIVMEDAGIKEGGEDCYPDVTDEWYAPYVCKATEEGFVKGYPDGTFKPGQSINFAEASKIVANVFELTMEEEDKQQWFKSYVYALEDRYAIPTGVLSFDQMLTRGDMSEIVFRLDNNIKDKKSNTFASIQKGEEADYDMDTMQNFRSCSALAAHVEQEYSYYGDDDVEEEAMMDFSTGAVPKAADAVVTESDGGSNSDYSTTNVQVEGVDEADIVKTDGEYIYVVKGDSVRIVKASPADELEEVDSVDFDDDDFYPEDMYVDGDRLVVIGTSYISRIYPYEDVEIMRDISFGGSVSKVYVFDISDQEDIELIREVKVEGDYSSSRKIDGMVYLVAHKYNSYYEPMPLIDEAYVPKFEDSSNDDEIEPLVTCSEVGYIPGPVHDRTSLIVMGIPVDDVDDEIVKEVVIGGGYNIYASRDNLYVAQDRYYWNSYWGGSDGEETVVHKFELDPRHITYEGNGVVPGTILNQFSMDEYDGHFRIATTKGNVWDSTNKSTNNVYVLDEDMELVGELEGLAPGERIYSMRFMGEKGYMVTFKKIDPLFVLDLSDHENPEVLGKLKIPGYSDYLHPYDEDHIIGFGKDTVEASEDDKERRDIDFAWYQGMKIAMFDVSDVENPIELHKVVIGDRGTTSDLLYNHKALLFDKSRDLMAFPVTVHELSEEQKNDPDAEGWEYGDAVFQGAYVYNVSVEDGFELKGTLSHYDEDEIANKSGYYWYGDSDIDRILYIGDYLYTVSRDYVMSHKMGDLSDVDSVELGGYDYPDYDYYW